MRIAGGQFGGRILAVPRTGDIRPTQDRVREALFSMLTGAVAGRRFLDLFAGCGAVGLEALSRGAAFAAFVERNPRHLAVLRENLTRLSPPPGAFALHGADAYRWIETYAGEPFDLAFADPPYALGEAHGYGAVQATLAAHGVVREGGVFIAEMTAAQAVEAQPGWELLRDRTYGKTRLCLWRRSR